MTISIDRLYDRNDATRINETGITWAVWESSILGAPNESGGNLSTDSAGAAVIPCVAVSGFVMLYKNDSLMGMYQT